VGARVENGEAKKAFVFGFGGEEDDVDVENEMSENVEDSDDVLEPDDGDRSDTIGGHHKDNNIRISITGTTTFLMSRDNHH